jgi:hypothetical protein
MVERADRTLVEGLGVPMAHTNQEPLIRFTVSRHRDEEPSAVTFDGGLVVLNRVERGSVELCRAPVQVRLEDRLARPLGVRNGSDRPQLAIPLI